MTSRRPPRLNPSQPSETSSTPLVSRSRRCTSSSLSFSSGRAARKASITPTEMPLPPWTASPAGLLITSNRSSSSSTVALTASTSDLGARGAGRLQQPGELLYRSRPGVALVGDLGLQQGQRPDRAVVGVEGQAAGHRHAVGVAGDVGQVAAHLDFRVDPGLQPAVGLEEQPLAQQAH